MFIYYYTVCYFTCIFYAVVRQVSMLFIDNKDSVSVSVSDRYQWSHEHSRNVTTVASMSWTRLLSVVRTKASVSEDLKVVDKWCFFYFIFNFVTFSVFRLRLWLEPYVTHSWRTIGATHVRITSESQKRKGISLSPVLFSRSKQTRRLNTAIASSYFC